MRRRRWPALPRRSVRRRILVAQLLPLAPAAVVGLVCVLGLLRMTWVVHEARTAGVGRVRVIGEVIDRFREEAVLLSRWRASTDPELLAAARERSAAVHAGLDELASPALLRGGVEPPEDLAVLVGDYERLAGLTGPLGDPVEAERAARHALRAMKDREAGYRRRIQDDLAGVAATGRATAVGVVVVLGVFLGTALLVSLALGRSVLDDIAALERGTKALAAGDFGHRIRLADPGRDDEFTSLAAAFNRMARRIAAMDQAREDFFANLSHDLKTPLTALVEAVDLLDEEVAGPLGPEQRELVRIARESAGRLRALVRNMLDLSRLRAADPELAPGDPIVEVDAALRELAPVARRREVRLVREGEEAVPEVLADGAMLRQVLYNLLDNALKHAPRGSAVRVAARVVGGEGGPAVEVRVCDAGPGIPPELRERVFERFFQAPGERSGTGLGLHICRRIVESHGGVVFVDDSPEGGACVGFRLPALVSGVHAAPLAGAPGHGSGSAPGG